MIRRLIMILSILTGGRPMRLLSVRFHDVEGKPVYNCVDQFGRKWWAPSRWSSMRVKADDKILKDFKTW